MTCAIHSDQTGLKKTLKVIDRPTEIFIAIYYGFDFPFFFKDALSRPLPPSSLCMREGTRLYPIMLASLAEHILTDFRWVHWP